MAGLGAGEAVEEALRRLGRQAGRCWAGNGMLWPAMERKSACRGWKGGEWGEECCVEQRFAKAPALWRTMCSLRWGR